MPTISMFYGIMIQMFWNDHAPPHFHALYAEHEALIDIRKLDLIEGDLPRRACAGTRMDAATSHRINGGLGIMSTQSTAKQDSAATLAPQTRPSMPWRVRSVEALSAYRLRVAFVDGLTGFVDMSALVRAPHAGVFASLVDTSVFVQAFVEHGAVTWPGEIDLAPDAMHAAISKNGDWVIR